MSMQKHDKRGLVEGNFPIKYVIYLGAALGTYAWRGDLNELIYFLSISIAISTVGEYLFRNYSSAGQGFLETSLVTLVLSFVWMSDVLISVAPSSWVQYPIIIGIALSCLMLPFSFGSNLVNATISSRKHWNRQPDLERVALASEVDGYQPKVSFHVPCYSEPPEVVIQTLNKLASIDYDNYEVLVIDNNTKDPALWRPLQTRCSELGNKFTFHHVDPLGGAKAGALNWALNVTSDDAEIITVVDADYQVQPDFLKKTVGLFKNDNLGFVQTSHDYRDEHESEYKKACYWEYMPIFKVAIPARNEWMAGFTVGTMCLIKKKALIECGLWAEWCLTEDSELAQRINALGYESYVVPTTFGRGLTPETFAEYKKQRFRWTVGPLQAFLQHWKMYLPRPFGKRTKLNPLQKIFETSHGLESASVLYQLLMFPISMLVMLYMITNEMKVDLPNVLLFIMGVSLMGSFFAKRAVYRRLGASLKEHLLGTIATASLSHVCTVGVLSAIFNGKRLQWRRTSKFKEMPGWSKALVDTKWEILKAGFFFLVGIIFFNLSIQIGNDLVLMTSIVMVITGLKHFAAPVMAISADMALSGTPATVTESAVENIEAENAIVTVSDRA
ncbi:MAG: glycosyltransferase [Pseudomonadota bacterium]